MAPSAKAKTPATASKTKRPVTLKHLAAVLAEEHQLTKKAGEALLGDLVGLITKHLKKGQRIRIAGLGILQVRRRAARMGRNPATGEAIQIKASKKVAFRAANRLERRATTKNKKTRACVIDFLSCISYTGTSYPDWVSS
jgi:DNA-binding protein HU-beta